MLLIVTPSTTDIIDLRTTEIKYMVKRPMTKAQTLINLWPEPSRELAFVSFHDFIPDLHIIILITYERKHKYNDV